MFYKFALKDFFFKSSDSISALLREITKSNLMLKYTLLTLKSEGTKPKKKNQQTASQHSEIKINIKTYQSNLKLLKLFAKLNIVVFFY